MIVLTRCWHWNWAKTDKARPVALCLMAVLTLAAGWWVHGMAGNTLPLPWDDEVSFFWPAVHWAQENTLLAPELNPDRDVMWMPPGMMVVLGTLFKVLPIRLEVARWVTWAMLAMGYLCCMQWVGRMKRAVFCACLLSGFFLNGAFTAAGNVVRMDAWVWGMGSAGFMLLHSKGSGWKKRLGWTLLGCSPLVHPNGLYFMLAALLAKAGLWIADKRENFRENPSGRLSVFGKESLPWWLVVLAVWIAYGVYAMRHGPDFMSDMTFQFARKGNRAPWLELVTWPTLGCLGWYLFFGVHSLVRNPRNLWLVGWGGANLMVYVIGQEMWYEIFWQTGWLWLVVLGFQLDIPLCGRWGKEASVLASCLLFVWAGQYFLKHSFIEGPREYVQELQWGWGMRLETEGQYISDNDRSRLKTLLEEVALDAGKPLRVRFIPSGDALICMECFGSLVKPFSPHFTKRTANCTIVHKSKYRPAWLLRELEGTIPDDSVPFHERGETEKWYIRKDMISMDGPHENACVGAE